MDTNRNSSSQKKHKLPHAEIPPAKQLMTSIIAAYISAPSGDITVDEISDIVNLLLMEQGYEKDGIQTALDRLVEDRCGAETH